MPIDVSCLSCERKLRVADKHCGKKTKCPGCGEVLRIPNLKTSPPEVLEAIIDEEPQNPEPERVPCPVCREMIMRSAMRCRFCKSIVDPDGHVVWRDGKSLVINRNAELPPECIKTGEPATIRKKIQLSWNPSAMTILVIAGALLAHLLAIKATVEIPLAPSYIKQRRKRIAIAFLLGFGGFCLFMGALIADLRDPILGICVVVGLVTMLTGLIMGFIVSTIVTATKITDNYVWMKGAKPVFLDTLPEWHGMD